MCSSFYNLLVNYNDRVLRQNTGEVTTLRDMNKRSKITAFVVADQYMNRLPTQRLEELKSDTVQLRQVGVECAREQATTYVCSR